MKCSMSIVIIDNSKKSLPSARLDGFMSAVDMYAHIHPDVKIKVNVIHYTEIDKNKKCIDGAEGFILSGSKLKLSNFYTSEKITTFRPEMDIILNTNKPILGVCFGHELMAIAYGFRVVRAIKPERGFVELKFLEPFPLLQKRKNVFVEMQHINQIEHTQRFDLFFTNYITSDGTTIGAFKHRFKKQYGVQFHPETFDYRARADGRDILISFLDVCLVEKLNKMDINMNTWEYY